MYSCTYLVSLGCVLSLYRTTTWKMRMKRSRRTWRTGNLSSPPGARSRLISGPFLTSTWRVLFNLCGQDVKIVYYFISQGACTKHWLIYCLERALLYWLSKLKFSYIGENNIKQNINNLVCIHVIVKFYILFKLIFEIFLLKLSSNLE